MDNFQIAQDLKDSFEAARATPDSIAAIRILEDAVGRAVYRLKPEKVIPEGYYEIDTLDGKRLSPMTQYEYNCWRDASVTTDYAGFRIKAKKDFGEHGFWEPKIRDNIKEGWVVTRGGCNPMPGGTWGRTQKEAQQLIDVFLAVEEDGQRFWHLLRAINAGGRK